MWGDVGVAPHLLKPVNGYAALCVLFVQAPCPQKGTQGLLSCDVVQGDVGMMPLLLRPANDTAVLCVLYECAPCPH